MVGRKRTPALEIRRQKGGIGMEITAARTLTEEIKRLAEQIELVRQSAKNLVPVQDGMPKPPNKGSPIEKICYRMLELEEKRREKIKELDAVKVALIDAICAAPLKDGERKVLMLRYVCCMRFRDIQFDLEKSDARIYQWHRAGLEKMRNYSTLTVAL